MKKLLLFIIVLLLISTLSYADVTEDVDKIVSESGDFSVEMFESLNKIPLGGKAVINLLVKNYENISRKYRLGFENTGEWLNIDTDPLYHKTSGVDINRASSEIININIRAKGETGYGTYFVKTTITNEDTSESVVMLLPVGIRTTEELQGIRVPDLRVSLNVPTKVDPREDNVFYVYLLNKNNRNIQELTIELESELIGERIIKESLEPNEEKDVEVNLNLDPLTESQEDTIKGRILVAGYVFTPTAKTYEVINYNVNLDVEESKKMGFFKSTKTITIENKGNNLISDTIKSEMGMISNIFTKTEPEARVVEIEGVKYYSWQVNVNPTVKSEITITKNYQPLFAFIVIIIGVLVAQYMIKSKVRVTKKSTSTGMSEGGLANIKILLTIRNDTNRPIKGIEVKDNIPQIADIVKEFPMGTVKPDKILIHKTKGTIVKWNIDELDTSEERIIKYEMKSKLSIIGSVTLPPTTVKYKTIRGRQRKVKSKILIVGKE